MPVHFVLVLNTIYTSRYFQAGVAAAGYYYCCCRRRWQEVARQMASTIGHRKLSQRTAVAAETAITIVVEKAYQPLADPATAVWECYCWVAAAESHMLEAAIKDKAEALKWRSCRCPKIFVFCPFCRSLFLVLTPNRP